MAVQSKRNENLPKMYYEIVAEIVEGINNVNVGVRNTMTNWELVLRLQNLMWAFASWVAGTLVASDTALLCSHKAATEFLGLGCATKKWHQIFC